MTKHYKFIFLCIFASISLVAQNNDTISDEGFYIVQSTGCTAEFSYDTIKKDGNTAMIKFRSKMKDSARYEWDFGDGSVSRDKHPVHTFDISAAHTFKVTLKVTARNCSDETSQTLSFSSEEGCSAEFTWEIVSMNKNNAKVKFTVTYPVSSANYKWSFGDGKATRKMNPSHTYNIKDEKKVSVKLSVNRGSCNDEKTEDIVLGESEPVETCSAEFYYEILSNDKNGAIVQFASGMEDADQYSWNFGDGSSSVDKNPIHAYTFKGKLEFKVTLNIKKGGCSDERSKTILFPEVPVEVEVPDCSADFTYEIVKTTTGKASVKFESAMPDASDYQWAFGDGETSKDQNPVHLFDTSRINTFQVTLEVGMRNCRDVKTQTIVFDIIEECSAAFSFEIIRSMTSGGVVQFTSAMTDASSYKWDFGDGSSGNQANPLHNFDNTKKQEFTVTLEVRKGKCVDTKSKKVKFSNTVEKACTARFSYEVIRQDKSKALVQFVTESSDSSAQYFWDFGDSTTSTKQNPVHTYKVSAKQKYEVTLETRKGDCMDSKKEVINISQGVCSAEFKVNITYNDGEKARVEIICKEDKPYAEFTCNFGDGIVSKEWNPIHTYNIARKKKYTIVLRVQKGDCDDQKEQEISF